MSYLLDTHVWLWMQMSPDRIPTSVRESLEDATTPIVLSSVSTWECAIKAALGKLTLPAPLEDMVRACVTIDGMIPLAITHEHCVELQRLPALHSDPFDRLLISQARHEHYTLVSADKRIRSYDVEVLEC